MLATVLAAKDINASKRLSALRLPWLTLLLLAVACVANAQSVTNYEGSELPAAVQPGAPAGSYPLSGFEDINIYNGNLAASVPLLKVGGRGGASYTIMQPLNATGWTVNHDLVTVGSPTGYRLTWYSTVTTQTSRNLYQVGFGPGFVQVRQAGKDHKPCSIEGVTAFHETFTFLEFVAPDGTVHGLYDSLAPQLGNGCTEQKYRGDTFSAHDGSGITFAMDFAIGDITTYQNPYSPESEYVWAPNGYLLMPDGTRYRVENGLVKWIRDRNGNKLDFVYDTYGKVTQITDSLKRVVTVQYNYQDVAPYGKVARIIYKGFGGDERIIRVAYKDETGAQHGQPLCDGCIPGATYVWLPDGVRRYACTFNSYGEISRLELPTGGAIEYTHDAGVNGAYASGQIGDSEYMTNSTPWDNGEGSPPPLPKILVYRRLVERRVYPSGGTGSTYEGRTTYSRPESANCTMVLGMVSDCTFTDVGYVEESSYDNGGQLLARQRHYFNGRPAKDAYDSLHLFNVYPDSTRGKEIKTQELSNQTVVRSVSQTWSGAVVTQRVTTLSDTNQVAKQVFNYDQFYNLTDVYEYNYGASAAGGLVRRTHTDYANSTNLINGVDYSTTAVHIRNLPVQRSVYNAAGVEQTRITYEYDNYTAVAPHAALVARPGISGLDPAYTTAKKTRGNATAVTRYLLSSGTVAGSISTYQQYDVAGNVVKSIDPLGKVTALTYTDNFGSPDGDAVTNSAPTELLTQQSYAFPTLVKNPKLHTTRTQRDYYTGQVVDAEDPNGVTSSAFYEDVLDRPTKVIRANDNNTLRNQTVFAYNDTARTVTTTSDFDTYQDTTPVKSQTVYDGLGRKVEVRQYETATAYIAEKTAYDELGRVSQVSNPFRNGQTPVWTTTAYDALGRVISVTTPDNAVFTTSYSGNTTTVTDQTGHDRQNTTDALGRLTQVVEDPGTGGLGYVTAYTYDVSDNLRKVTQGSQARYFMYDSLSRLIRVKNPEQNTNASLAVTDPVTNNSQWSIGYTYDDNGNILTRTDARNLMTEYGYDDLNRNKSVAYKSGTVTQERVVRTYDTAPNGIGRLASSYYYIDVGTNAGANSQTTIDSYDAMGRPLSQSQYFYANGAWGTPFVTQRTYNLAGAVTSQTYPSGRVVNYNYDLAGRTLSFTGNLGDGVTRNYATSITYDQWGGLTRERFGTTTPLYHKERRNIRGQLYDMRLSTVNDADNWNRGAITNYYSVPSAGPRLDIPDNAGPSGTDNNGNLYVQQHWVPVDNSITSSSFMQQNYVYDELNRLKSVTESPGGNTAAPSGSQLFTYDRYGNRTIAPASWGTGINEQQFIVLTSNKNQLGVPTGQTGLMQYDAAGNLYNDTYSGTGSRTFDHENRIVAATNTAEQQSIYTYDADGSRVRRKSYNEETWQIYGMEGELLAEYASGAATSASQKEYGYRNGQLLIVAAPGADVRWLMTDHLGTPRIISDRTGSLTGIKRHDYLPFGEEMFEGTGNRTLQQGYPSNLSNEGTRQQFTQKERDIETGLDFFGARYYSSALGRFTSPDQPFADQLEDDPQTWNLYAYTRNQPLTYVDPLGLWKQVPCGGGFGGMCWVAEEGDDYSTLVRDANLGLPWQLVALFFQNQLVTPGMVVSLSGFDDWVSQTLGVRLVNEVPGPTIRIESGLPFPIPRGSTKIAQWVEKWVLKKGGVKLTRQMGREVREDARQLANEFLKEAKQAGVGAGARSGQHGKPFFEAARRLREMAKDQGLLPEFREEILKKATEFETKGGRINHAVQGRGGKRL